MCAHCSGWIHIVWKGGEESKEANATLTVVDDRNGKKISIPVSNGTIDATELQKLGLRIYDPGFMNTAVCRSSVCFIDGDVGILRYRGYDIEELAEKSTFLEVAFLLIMGELPNKVQLEHWTEKVMKHTFVHENAFDLMKTFRYDAHPMGIVVSSLSAMSTFFPELNPALQGADLYIGDREKQFKQVYRVLGKMPTIAANAYRHRIGRPYNYPRSDLTYTENFLYMMDKLSESDYRPDPRLAKALDVLFILHAEHELNCSTAALRHLASSRVDPFTAVAGATGALYGPLHGGANEAVLRMLEAIEHVDNVPQFIEDVKNRKRKLMGFGHRVYKNYDPRARIVKSIADEVFSILGKDPLIDVAIALEQVALNDPYFIKRKLYPNVDFYSGLIYKAMGFPTDMFPVLFALPRAAGWLAHWVEMLDDPELRIYRPRQIYEGEDRRPFTPLHARKEAKVQSPSTFHSPFTRRRERGSTSGSPVSSQVFSRTTAAEHSPARKESPISFEE